MAKVIASYEYQVPDMDLADYLAVVAMLMRRIGWISRTAARQDDSGRATADDAYTYLFSTHPEVRKWIERNELYADESDKQRALSAIGWALGVDDNGNEYLNTIKRIALSGRASFDGLDGYAASIIIAAEKAAAREREQAEKAAGRKERVHFGELKKRAKGIKVTCVGLHSFEGFYGVKTVVRFRHDISDQQEAILVWFEIGGRYNDWRIDDEYVIDATPTLHEEHPKYGVSTKINRVTDKTPATVG